MAVSNGTEHGRRGSFWASLFGQLSRYDLVLTVIPLVLAMAFAGYFLFSIPFEVAVACGGGLSLAVMVDALFLHPPVETQK